MKMHDNVLSVGNTPLVRMNAVMRVNVYSIREVGNDEPRLFRQGRIVKNHRDARSLAR